MDYSLTKQNVETQLAAIRARAEAVTLGLDEQAINWQPDGGRRWSIAQCLDHLVRTSALYGQALEAAIAAAPPIAPGPAARPNLLGRVLIWVIEPPNLVKVPAKPALMPPSRHVPEVVLRQYDDSLEALAALTDRALRVDAGRARYANPLAGDVRTFNVATGIMVMLAHNRRHLVQAERVRVAALKTRPRY